MSQLDKHLYEFGPFRLDAAKRVLLREGESVPLVPKVLETLLVLVRNSERILDKEELMQSLWPDTIVEEVNLAQNISRLRKALGESPGEHRYIVTVPGRGYRFVADVKEVPDAATDLVLEEHNRTVIEQLEVEEESESLETKGRLAQARSVLFDRRSKLSLAGLSALLLFVGLLSAYIWVRKANRSVQLIGTQGVRSLAVLPFKPLNADGEDEYLGLGITDTLIFKLGNIQQLIVRPTSAVRKYAAPDQDALAAGREQQVEAVLEGSIQRSGEKIRVTVRLMDVKDGKSLWAYQCSEQECADIFAMQDAISAQVAQALLLKLSAPERARLAKHYTENRPAYELYIKGRYFWNKRSREGYEKAIEYFRQAIELDPNYALAYAGLADAYTIMMLTDHQLSTGHVRGSVVKAKEAARRALEIDDTLAEVHASLAKVRFNYDWDFAEAREGFVRAIELNPNYAPAHYWYAGLLGALGQYEESVAEAKRAQSLDPLSSVTSGLLGSRLEAAGQVDEAIAQLHKALELDPNYSSGYFMLGRCYIKQRRYEDAIDALNKAIASGSEESKASLAYALALSGSRMEAQHILDELSARAESEPIAFYVAIVYAGLGDRDRVFEWLERAYAERSPTVLWFRLNSDPYWDGVRSDARFRDLLRRMGLPEVTSDK